MFQAKCKFSLPISLPLEYAKKQNKKPYIFCMELYKTVLKHSWVR